nr:hypothetical protein GCM10020092_028710 [Actinoplanes digitatis]
MRDEAEAVAHGPGEQPGPGGGADQRERLDIERDRGGAGALADDHVDPEVLHRAVEQLLGRLGDAVDLVDEQHVALGEPGEDRGEIAGTLDDRAAGGPDPGAELRRHDVGERRLAQPGRAGQQDVIGRRAPALRATQQQLQLVAHPVLRDELGQAAWPDAHLRVELLVARERGDQVVGAVGHRVRPSRRMA